MLLSLASQLDQVGQELLELELFPSDVLFVIVIFDLKVGTLLRQQCALLPLVDVDVPDEGLKLFEVAQRGRVVLSVVGARQFGLFFSQPLN